MKHINIPEYKGMVTVADDCPQEVIDALKELCRLAYHGLGKDGKKKEFTPKNPPKVKNPDGSDHNQYG